jgi:hypothetical protein
MRQTNAATVTSVPASRGMAVEEYAKMAAWDLSSTMLATAIAAITQKTAIGPKKYVVPPASTAAVALPSLTRQQAHERGRRASLSRVARCLHNNAYFLLFSSLFFFDPPNRFVQIPRDLS